MALANNPSGATLGGTLTVTAQDGVADFSDLTLNEAGTGYTLDVSGVGVIATDDRRLRRHARGRHSIGRNLAAAQQRHGRQSIQPDYRGRRSVRQRGSQLRRQHHRGTVREPRRCHPRRHAECDGTERHGHFLQPDDSIRSASDTHSTSPVPAWPRQPPTRSTSRLPSAHPSASPGGLPTRTSSRPPAMDCGCSRPAGTPTCPGSESTSSPSPWPRPRPWPPVMSRSVAPSAPTTGR